MGDDKETQRKSRQRMKKKDNAPQAVKETDWIVYWLTPQGLKLWTKKIDAILCMDCPCNATELCMIIGYINYYCEMWLSRAHILKQLMD